MIDLYKRGSFVLDAKLAEAAVQPSLLTSETQCRANIRHSPGGVRHMHIGLKRIQ